jgi:hypothetical protein
VASGGGGGGNARVTTNSVTQAAATCSNADPSSGAARRSRQYRCGTSRGPAAPSRTAGASGQVACPVAMIGTL